MKPLIISTVCVFLLISTWAIFMNHTSKTIEALSLALAEDVYAPIAANDWEAAEEGIKTVSESWHEHKIIIYMLSNHVVVRETDISIAKAAELIKNQSQTESLTELAVIYELFISIQQGEAFSIDNLL